MKKVIFSFHARKRMLERNIRQDIIFSVLEMPDYSIKRLDEIEFFKRIGGNTLKVVIAEKENFIKVVTIYYLK